MRGIRGRVRDRGRLRGCGYASCPRVLVSSCPLALSASQVGLTVLGRPGSAFGNGVRHIIAARDEATGELTSWPVGQLTGRGRRADADQQGRWSLPRGRGIRGRVRDRGRLRGSGYASCPPVLSASQVGLTVLGRPGSAFGNEVRHIIAARDEATGELTSWPVGMGARDA